MFLKFTTGTDVPVPQNYRPQGQGGSTGIQPNGGQTSQSFDARNPQASGRSGLGVIGNLAKDAYTTLIARPANRVGQALAYPVVSAFGSEEQKKKYFDLLNQPTEVPTPFGGTTTVDAPKSGVQGAKQIAGEALQTASYLTPLPGEGAIANPILRGLAGGGISGSLAGAGNALAEGGNATDVAVKTLEGGFSGAATGGALSAAAPVARAAVKTTNAVSKFATSNLTGLNKDTISTILHTPEKITPEVMTSLNRDYLGNKVHKAVQSRLGELSYTGSEYQAIRDSRAQVVLPKETIIAPVPGPNGQTVPKSFEVNDLAQTVLKKYGLEIDPRTNQILTSKESVPLTQGDLTALNQFYSQYGKHTDLTSNSLLNTRQALDNLADHSLDPNKTDISNKIAKDLRAGYDELGKGQIPGLAELDAKFAPERKLLGQIRHDYLNPDGTLKDNALNKIANLGNKGKSIVLQRLEKITPGIGQDINILRAVEDVRDASGIKIGTYARSGLTGLVLGGGNPWAALMGIVLSTPQVAVPIIRNFALAKKISMPLVDNLINRMKNGKPLSEPMKRLISVAFANAVTRNGKQQESIPQNAGQSTDAYLKSLGI